MNAWTLKDIFADPAINYVKFRYDTMVSIQKRNSWIKFYKPKPNIQGDIINILQPAIRLTPPDEFFIEELPPDLRYCPLSDDARTEYTDILKSMQKNKDNLEYLTSQFVRLRMLLCGYSKDKDMINFKSKLEECSNIIDESENKVIIFCPFIEPLKELNKNLSKQYDTITVYGDTSTEDRAKIFNAFQNSDKYKVLIAHPNCMAHGITLTRANIVIYFSPPNGTEIYIQSKGRVKRYGQKFPVKIVQLYSSHIEKAMYKKLDNNEDFQNDILALISEKD
jgi:SNF2 family DNA or RNA helicase